jgi:aspartate/tyrosine/aromatic aminotransferase
MANFPVSEWIPADDPILGLNVAFRKDARPNKVNLGVGAYRTAAGQPLVLPSITTAETMLLEKKLNKEYLPIDGDADFVQAIKALVFGDLTPKLHMFGAQMIGGTGALRMGGEYLSLGGPRSIYLSTPTWANHKSVFSRAGLKVENYPYYDRASQGIDFAGMCRAITQMPAGSVVLLHGCCHNPTGVDLTHDQWHALSQLIKTHHLIPFFDLAYQGLGDGLDADAYSIRYFAEQGHELLVAYSCAKNFGLYGERVGFLAVVTHDAASADIVGRQLKTIIRANWSNPPTHGARLVTTILKSESLRSEWLKELESMRERITEMRKALASGLCAKGHGCDYNVLVNQRGLFSFGFLDHDQVQLLRSEYAIYCPDDGRINVAGLNPQNIGYVIEAIEAVAASRR